MYCLVKLFLVFALDRIPNRALVLGNRAKLGVTLDPIVIIDLSNSISANSIDSDLK